MKMKFLLVFLIILTSQYVRIQSEVFTALVDITKALDTQREIGKLINDFVVKEREELIKLSEFSKQFDSSNYSLESNSSIKYYSNLEAYFSNPINAYHFAKKSVKDWQEKIKILNEFSVYRNSESLQIALDEHKARLPREEDIDGAIDALLRLQETYHLKTEDLMYGKVQSFKTDDNFNANDCFKIGLRAYQKKLFYYGYKWFNASLTLFNNNQIDKSDSNLTKEEIMDYLSYCLGSIGRYREAFVMTLDLINNVSGQALDRLRSNIDWYKERLAENVEQKTEAELEEGEEDATYKSLCRGENPISINNGTKPPGRLYCYLNRKHPYLWLRPLKVEVAFDYPRLYVLHDIIYDSEIQHIKEVSASKLNRATVRNPITGNLETASYRISKSAWLPNSYDKVTEKLNKRIVAVTGLSIETAEDLQVVNYGIGGHYSPHFDHGRNRKDDDDFDRERGNRVATLLFYLSDVDAGGATVFVDVGAKLWPSKGSAAFWYNLKRSGASDDLTRHAACPVLVGSKWVMNKWFREKGQEFVRPCALESHL